MVGIRLVAPRSVVSKLLAERKKERKREIEREGEQKSKRSAHSLARANPIGFITRRACIDQFLLDPSISGLLPSIDRRVGCRCRSHSRCCCSCCLIELEATASAE